MIKINKDKTRKMVCDIIELWNTGVYHKKIHARNKLQMAKSFLKPKTYNYLADRMGEARVPDPDGRSFTEQSEERDILKDAQGLFGGKIID
jgi:hypothetical protein